MDTRTTRTRARLFAVLLALAASLYLPLLGGEGEEASSLRILFVGDTSFGESYQERMARHGATNMLKAEGYGYSLRKLHPLLQSADLVIANLETPITSLAASPLVGRKRYLHRGDPRHAPAALSAHGIDVVSLANNHAMDYGAAGLAETVETLRAAKIDVLGAGNDAGEASRPWVRTLDVGGRKLELAVIAGYERTAFDERLGSYAGDEAAGVNGWSADVAARQGRALRAAEPDAFIVAFPHWGRNYRWRTAEQGRMADSVVAAGIDLILGHGAHMLQEIERRNGSLVLFGLGNFMFNSAGRYARNDVRPFSLAAALDVTASADGLVFHLRLYPIFSDNQITVYQPYLVSDEELNEVRALLAAKSPQAAESMDTGRDEVGGFLELRLR